MAYNFQKALDSGLSQDGIKDYLYSKGRQSEYDEYFKTKSSAPKPLSIQSSAPSEVASALEGPDNIFGSINKAVMPVAETVLGAGKAAVETLATVPQNISRVTSGLTKAFMGTDADESRGQLADITTQLIQRVRTLPEGKEKQDMASLIQNNMELLASLDEDAKERDSQLDKGNNFADTFKPTNDYQGFGYGAEKVAEFMVPGKSIRSAETLLSQTLKNANIPAAAKKALEVFGRAGLEGAGATTVATAQGKDFEDVRNAGLFSAILSVPFKTLDVLRKPTSQLLKGSADKSVSQSISATGKEMKNLSDKVVPQLLKRKFLFLTRGNAVAKADKFADEFGSQIDQAFSALPPNTRIVVSPIINTLEEVKGGLTVKGSNIIPDAVKGKYEALQNIQREIIDIARKDLPRTPGAKVGGVMLPEGAETISVESLRSFKQIVDKAIKETKSGFGLTGSETAKVLAQKSATNAIREELAQEFPEIAKLNKEYTFWKNVQTLFQATIDRTKSQETPLTQTIAEAAGAVAGGAGAATGAGVLSTGGGIIATGLGLKLFKKAITSPAWRMTSGVVKDQLADQIAKGNSKEVLDILSRIATGLYSTGSSDGYNTRAERQALEE